MFYVQIVDDEPIVRIGMEKMLNWKALGFEVVCSAQNGKQALEQLQVEKVDLIITDIQMPVMDGLSFIKEVRTDELNQKLPNKEIIVLTAYDDFEYARTALKYGVSEYILKPGDIEEITDTLLGIKKRLEEKRNESNS